MLVCVCVCVKFDLNQKYIWIKLYFPEVKSLVGRKRNSLCPRTKFTLYLILTLLLRINFASSSKVEKFPTSKTRGFHTGNHKFVIHKFILM